MSSGEWTCSSAAAEEVPRVFEIRAKADFLGMNGLVMLLPKEVASSV